MLYNLFEGDNMNNINCEHCGSLINTDVDKKCPNCGAPYKNNKQYKEYLEYQKKQRELNLETQQLKNDITRDVHNTSKKAIPGMFIFVFVIFIISTVAFFFIFYNAFGNMNDYQNNYEDYQNNYELINELQKDKENIVIMYNEYALTDQYNIKVNKIIKYVENKYEKNKTYYGFHIVFKNKTNTWKTLNDINLIYVNSDGEETTAQKPIVSANKLDYFAKDIITYDGYLYFDIPNDVKDVTIYYDNIYIKIFDFKNKIK